MQAAPKREWAPGTLYNVERLNDSLFQDEPMPVSGPFHILGWLGDPARVVESPELVFATRKGEEGARPLVLSIDRPDVVAAYPGVGNLARSGFDVQVDPAQLAPGDYHVYLRYRLGQAYRLCDNGRIVRVGPRLGLERAARTAPFVISCYHARPPSGARGRHPL